VTGTTRRSLLAGVSVGLVAAGCLSDSEADLGGSSADESTTDEASTSEISVEAQTKHASDSPEPDHSIYLGSEAEESRRVRVRIVREATGETVFETTVEASAGEYTLYNLREADPEGVEAFRVCAELVESETAGTEITTPSPRRDCMTIRTSECYGNAHVTVEDDDSVRIIYAIC
jgi:hypothetical protein